MPTREQVWASADHVQTTGERVTQKRVLDHLRAAEIGCTERTIDAHLIAWKATRSYNPRLAVLDLPGPLSTRLAGFMEGLWDAAMAEANARLEERRAYLEREREAAGQLLNETQIRAEETARENEALRARQVVKDTTTAALRAEVVALRKEVAHLRRSEFWDHVIREIAEILPEKDWMSIEEIVRRLPPSLAKEALVLDKALTPGRVNRQMFLRDHHSRFFEKKRRKRSTGSVRAGRASRRRRERDAMRPRRPRRPRASTMRRAGPARRAGHVGMARRKAHAILGSAK